MINGGEWIKKKKKRSKRSYIGKRFQEIKEKKKTDIGGGF